MRFFRQHLSTFSCPFTIDNSPPFLVSESSHPEEKLLNFQIVSWDPKKDSGYIKRLENYRKKILLEAGENYFPDRLDFMDQEVITVFLKEGNILGFCTAWRRETYPDQTARILNRFYFDPCVRRTGTKIVLRFPVFISIEHQCLILKNKGLKWVFISRPYGSYRWCHQVEKILNEQSLIKGWKASEDLVLVCHVPNSPKCWQFLVFGKLGEDGGCFELLENRLSREEFIEKFKKKK